MRVIDKSVGSLIYLNLEKIKAQLKRIKMRVHRGGVVYFFHNLLNLNLFSVFSVVNFDNTMSSIQRCK